MYIPLNNCLHFYGLNCKNMLFVVSNPLNQLNLLPPTLLCSDYEMIFSFNLLSYKWVLFDLFHLCVFFSCSPVVSIGRFRAFYVVFVPLEYVPTIPPHSTFAIVHNAQPNCFYIGHYVVEVKIQILLQSVSL